MTLMNYSFILGKTILRSSEFEDIETWNQQKRTVGCSCFLFKIGHKSNPAKKKTNKYLICYKEKSNSRK